MSSLTLGDFQLTALSDGLYYADGGVMFGVVPRVMWSRRVNPDAQNRIPLGLNSLLIRTGRHNVLVETGIGNKIPDKIRKIYSHEPKLLDSLAAAGVKPADIDVVINTHLHFDHCGWNTVRQGELVVPTFPNARYYVQEGEWRHGSMQHERDRISYISDNYDPLIRSGQMQLLYGDQEIVPGVSVKVYPGHTRNMQAVMIKSHNEKACYVSDLVPTMAHADITWVMAFDLFPLETIESRKRFYEVAIPEKWLVIFTHEPGVPFGRCALGENGKVVARPLEGATAAVTAADAVEKATTGTPR